jgi:DNA-binding protein WhiA
MSFSSEVKKELSKIANLANKKLVKQELIGYLVSCNSSIITKKKIRYATESEYNINRFSKLLTNLQIDHEIEIEGASFVITINKKQIDFIKLEENKIKIGVEEQAEKSEEEHKAFIRGTFLGGGSINNPENTYHLEIVYSSKENASLAKTILSKYQIITKELERKNKYSLYEKEAEQISNLLAFMGANRSVLNFEEIRVQKEMRGKVNRLVNCETANLTKTINASIEQIEAIKKLQETNQFNQLDDNLKEIALLRLENPDMSLIELGKKLNQPVGKSGVNYRLKKIIELSNLPNWGRGEKW